VTGGFAVSSRFLQFNCTGDSKTVQDEFEKQVESAYKKDAASVPYYMVTRNIITASYAGTKAIIAYVGIYIGLVFLLTSAAVLSLQQLSEISDNRQRYLVLKKIGADDHLINITILRQTAIYFLLPLSLAIVHSIVGLTVANDAIRSLGGVNAIQNILITAALILVIYGAYFLATFAGSRRMIVREGRNE
jgi:putative ABC transport system permease protein